MEAIREELRSITARIDAAYWAFTRSARGKPPVVALGKAIYQRRAYLEALLRAVNAGRASVLR